ncbi:putative pectinesterase/pectinesterase inhibitor 28 [Chenopodium quinoa]|uniref:putative pectinesterase/pectinesterase inhibitor 28 n=1 Tax=Chenopodium quinoa TaxID=63459 RepID=UPI000B78C0B1|nr:putative pectinesterase/pectinesterase inhibitor 28 [Chenopodium quinoa]
MSGDHDFNVEHTKKKKVAFIGISSLMMLGMVVAVTIGIKDTGNGGKYNDDDDGLATSSKAARSVCHVVEHRHACERTLAHVHTSDPNKIVQTTFNAAVVKLEGALAKSSSIKVKKDDPRTAGALEACKEAMEYAIGDLKRSIDQMGHFDIRKRDECVENMRVWLSSSMTFLETCIDAFENTTGDAEEKMKSMLNGPRELTCNSMDVATELYTIFKSLKNTNTSQAHKRSRAEEKGKVNKEGEAQLWADLRERKLLHERGATMRADVIVSKDGSSKFKTITEALKEAPHIDANKVGTIVNKTFVIYIKEGTYEEDVRVEATMSNVMFIGDGPTKTIITGKKSFADGFALYKTATISIMGRKFIAKDIGFENSAGAEKHQAIALLVQSDMSIFYNCHINGYHNTLYAHSYRQFYRHCTITGTIDFIFGNAAAVFQNTRLVIRKPLEDQDCVITAQGRLNIKGPTGFILQNCTIMADPLYYPLRHKNKAFLGQPRKKFSRTIILQSYLADSIDAEGWKQWSGTFAEDTCYFAEFENRGPGATLTGRAKWHGIKNISKHEADGFTPEKFYDGNRWIRPTVVPYIPGMVPK